MNILKIIVSIAIKILFLTFIFTACSTFNFNQLNVPIEKPQKYRFAQMDTLPGAIFKPNFNLRIDFDSKGNFLLAPGDYLIPVMTYCISLLQLKCSPKKQVTRLMIQYV